jgi:hypothetical protein
MVGLVRSLPGAALTPAGILRVPLAAATPALAGLEALLDLLERTLGRPEEGRRASGL